jgi:hypothetical protein
MWKSSDAPEEDGAKFGYMSRSKVEFLWNPAIFLTPSLKLWSKYGELTFLNDFLPFYPQQKRKTLNRPKEMNAVSTKVLLRFFPPVCSFARFIFTLSCLGMF